MTSKHQKTEGILRDFAEEYDYPYRFMSNDVPPSRQRDKARRLLVEETAEKLQSDGYHTFDELYHYRALYHAAFANKLYDAYQEHETIEGVPIKSRKHSDGKYCFDADGEWFVVTIQLPTGQITNHYHSDYWDLFRCSASERAPEWDGHTPQEAAERLEKYLKGDWENE